MAARPAATFLLVYQKGQTFAMILLRPEARLGRARGRGAGLSGRPANRCGPALPSG